MKQAGERNGYRTGPGGLGSRERKWKDLLKCALEYFQSLNHFYNLKSDLSEVVQILSEIKTK